MRVPRLLLHVFDNESTTVTLGFWVFIVASLAAFVVAADRRLTPETWLWCVVLASILVGGKLVSKSILEAIEIKLGGKPNLKEEESDAKVPAVAPPANP